MAIVLSFVPCAKLVRARRQAAPHARFDPLSKTWSMSEAEYAAFWLEALTLRHEQRITVHTVNGHVLSQPQVRC